MHTVIRAKLSPTILARSTSFFDHSDRTILHELLQNARRAGATQVEITLGEQFTQTITDDRGKTQSLDAVPVTIADNGCGIDDPSIILTFGGSKWSDELIEREDAAGMGVWSLSNREVSIISSRDWLVRLNPRAFAGHTDVKVEPHAYDKGTMVSYNARKTRESFIALLAECVRYYPVRVLLNGAPMEQRVFLDDALATQVYDGYRIGVYCTSDYDPTSRVNFYGRVISAPESRALRVLVPLGRFEERWTQRVCYFACIDVSDTAGLRFVLPARDAIAQTEAYHAMVTEAKAFLYRVALQRGEVLSHQDAVAAEALGMAPNQPTTLKTWFPKDRCDNVLNDFAAPAVTPIAENPAILWFDEIDAVNIGHAIINSESTQRFVRSMSEYTGYASYDALRRVAAASYHGVRDGATFDFDEMEEKGEDFSGIYNELAVHLEFDAAEGEQAPAPIVIPARMLAFGDTIWDGASIVAVKGVEVSELSGFLMYALFQYYEDGDTFETQREEADDEADAIARKLLLTKEQMDRDAREGAVHQFVLALRRLGITGAVASQHEYELTLPDGTVERGTM